MAQIGCETHSVTITARNGALVVGSGTGSLTEVKWNRVLNDTSTATATFGVSGPDCCSELGNIRSWACTLNVYRGSDFVWSGPVVNVDWSFGQVVVEAVDLIGLLDRRVPHQDFDFTATDLTEIAEELIEDGLAPDDPGHTTTIIGEAGVDGGRAYQEGVGQTADHLRDLSDTGIDFTAVGNNIVILPDDFCDVVGRLSDEDLPEGVTVSEDGASLATRWTVSGGNPAGTFLGSAGGTDAYYGLLERYDNQSSITSQAAADAAAQARLSASSPVPTTINTQNITLAPTAAVDLLTLVPGWCLDITTAITCRQITQRLKIAGLQVTENGERETIQVQVIAPSS